MKASVWALSVQTVSLCVPGIYLFVSAARISIPGNNVGIGSDDTLFALIAGIVKFERKGKDKRQVSVYPQEEKQA